jgi:hypothetical protein
MPSSSCDCCQLLYVFSQQDYYSVANESKSEADIRAIAEAFEHDEARARH